MFRQDCDISGTTKTALSFYMHKYLEFLQAAGYHTLYDLPDFDNKMKAKLDYSLHYAPIDLDVLCAGVSLHGTNVQELNSSLHRKWLNAASAACDLPEDPLSVCIAEMKSSWLDSATEMGNFHMRLGPPTITALCQSEIIISFEVEDIAFFHEESSE